MNKILVPVDFSTCAENAAEFAAGLATKLNAKITLFHAYDIPFSSGYIPYELYADERSRAKNVSDDDLKKLSARIHKKHGLSCKIKSGHELTIESILKAVDEEKADMVVMGTCGAVTMPKRLSGTNALAVSEQAHCPVLIVPECWKFSELHDVILTTDYEQKDVERMAGIVELFKPLKVHFSIVHVADAGEDGQVAMARFVEALREMTSYKDISHTTLPEGPVTEKLEMYLRERPADLLVLSPHHHSLFGKLFGRSVSSKMIAHAETPVLTVH